MIAVPAIAFWPIQVVSILFEVLAFSVLLSILFPVISYAIRSRTGDLEPDEEPPPPRSGKIWFGFFACAILGVVGFTIFTRQEPPPPPTPTPAPITLELLHLTTPIKCGQDATLQVRAAPDIQCHLSYETPAENPSQAKGLGPTTADSQGVCTWNWHIQHNTSPGTGILTVQAASQTATYPIEIQE